MHTGDFITALFTSSIMLCAKVAISKHISLLWLVAGYSVLDVFSMPFKSCAFERADCWRVVGSSVRPLRWGVVHHASVCTK